MLGATSCSSDEVPAPVTGGETSFTVRLPEDLGSRTFGDGKSATTLTYAVYEKGTNTVDTVGTAQFSGLQTTVSLNLPRGKKFDIIFWAQNPAAPYKFSAGDQNVTVDYDKMTSYSEDYDAFCFVEKDFSITSAQSVSVTLLRPFAQLNVGTLDLGVAEGMGLDVATSKITVNDVYTTFNFMDGVQGDVAPGSKKESVTFEAPLPADTEKFPVTDPAGIGYLSMNYLLVPADKMTTSVTLGCSDPDFAPFTFENVPFQRNFRTNIYGNLLTSPADFTVVIAPSFNEFWDGSESMPDFGDGTTAVKITTPAQLAWIIEHASEENGFYAGKDFEMTGDFDMNRISLPDNTKFNGNFDGKGHTISNLKGRSGLFNTVEGATVKNINFEDITVSSGGAVTAVLRNGGVIENISVNGNSTISGAYTGGIVGSVLASTVKDCKVNSGVYISGLKCVGGIVGSSQGGTIAGCSNAAQISGTGSNGYSIGGIAGQQVYGGRITGCVNNGTVKAPEGAYGIGGIAGIIRYKNDTSSNPDLGVNGIIEVSGCSNTASVTGNGTDVGGIVGLVYNFADIHANSNTAPALDATANVAGILGSFRNPTPAIDNYRYMDTDPVCYVTGNSSATAADAMTGTPKAAYCNTNGLEICHVEGNTGADW